MLKASEDIQRIAGTFVAEEVKPPTHAWMANEMRTGSLRSVVEQFASEQEEPCDVQTVIVDSIDELTIVGRFPLKLADHESRTPFRADVQFQLNPATGEIQRLF